MIKKIMEGFYLFYMSALELIIAAMPFPTTVFIFLNFANWVCHRFHHLARSSFVISQKKVEK